MNRRSSSRSFLSSFNYFFLSFFHRPLQEALAVSQFSFDVDSVEWEKKFKPVLEHQERIPKFDIQQCSQQLLHKFDETNQTRTFRNLVQGQTRYDVCRQFVSSLQLVSITSSLMLHLFLIQLYLSSLFFTGEHSQRFTSISRHF
jgi:hypothetical protein